MRWLQVLDLRRALHAEPGSAEALRLAALRADDVSQPHQHTFDAVMRRTRPPPARDPSSPDTVLH